MEQPQIKIVPKHIVASPAEEHAYVPDPPKADQAAQAPKEEKLIGQMNANEMTELMVKAILQADKVREDLKDEKSYQDDENRGPVGKVLGTVGDVAHAGIDIIEGAARGIIDMATFGKAKRK